MEACRRQNPPPGAALEHHRTPVAASALLLLYPRSTLDLLQLLGGFGALQGCWRQNPPPVAAQTHHRFPPQSRQCCCGTVGRLQLLCGFCAPQGVALAAECSSLSSEIPTDQRHPCRSGQAAGTEPKGS